MSAGRRIAILIGNSKFSEEPSLSALRCPKRDVNTRMSSRQKSDNYASRFAVQGDSYEHHT